ncbi:MAG: hypothetical protein IJU31_04485 [Synergistaceae bacterium]|nr:hypothetical protein [Synergistaceae bacterium]
MRSKKFFAALVLVAVLSASSACAKVTEQQALGDQRIAPYIETTKQQGASLLPGRYAHIKEIMSRANTAEKINAPSSLIIEIGQFDTESNAYPSNFDVYGSDLASCWITLDTSGAVPVMKTYAANEGGEYEMVAEDYAVVMPEGGNKYAWLLGSVETGDVRYMFPINETFFPQGWYEGDWLGADGAKISLEDDGTITAGGNPFGTYIISDNRIAVKTPSGERDVIYCLYNPDNETIVMTFTSGPNGMGENAEVFVEDDDDDEPTPQKPKAPVFKAPAPKKPTQTAPKGFPKFPGPAVPEASLEGVWQAMVNGQQLVMQFQGNNYYLWLNGQPAEMGTFQRSGNVLTGVISNTGKPFRNTVNIDPSGNSFTLTDPNNVSITYYLVRN